MKNILLITLFSLIGLANENIINTKKCEVIKLSNYTTLVSCHDKDYLIEYKNVLRDDADTIKKITLITSKDQKIILTSKL